MTDEVNLKSGKLFLDLDKKIKIILQLGFFVHQKFTKFKI